MFEALRWRRPPFGTEQAMRLAADSLAQAGKTPLVLGSLAAVALLGMFARMGLTRRGRSKATVFAARIPNGGNKMHSLRNGRRRRKRKMKAAAH